MKEVFQISSKIVTCYFDEAFNEVQTLYPDTTIIYVTDENIIEAHADKFQSQQVIVVKAGEKFKQQSTVDYIVEQLIILKADRQTLLVGVGGGVVTDITGYTASVYMRGIRFGFVPTTILAMVDAAIGGKNGVDVGIYKNLVGCIKQPDFLIYDYIFLQTLPKEEWINGFAEIIKHAAIKDADLFSTLQKNSIENYRSSIQALNELIRQNVKIKMTVVAEDEFEKGDRKLLNFGHTLGHAIENIYLLPHGSAISIGMAAAAKLSNEMNDFSSENFYDLKKLLQQYHLPVQKEVDAGKIWEVLLMDKKKLGDGIQFVVLDKIGQAKTITLPTSTLELFFKNYFKSGETLTT
ncbi:MAG: 3-dehydroquinate synthase [Ginsengibacter sp.]